MKIYTRTGDDGTTGLSGGTRVAKSAPRMAAIGDVDELNAILGWCRSKAHDSIFELRLASIQRSLFCIGAELSCPSDGRLQWELLREDDVRLLEDSIDVMVDELEPLSSFILPGGSELASMFHFARTICRRAERAIAAFGETEDVRSVILVFVNRLSDWLFVAARTANRVAYVEEIKWNREE